jgi:hypothetical protein
MKKSVYFTGLFVCLFVSVFVASCEKNEIEDGVHYGSVDRIVNATVENGNLLNDMISYVYAIVIYEDAYGETDIDFLTTGFYSNGGFSVLLPETLNEKYFESANEYFFGGIQPGVSVSDASVGLCTINFVAITDVYVYLFYSATGYGYNNWEGRFVYASGDLSITGSYDEYSESNVKYTNKIDVHLKKGYNVLYVNGFHTENVTTTPPAGLKWLQINDVWHNESSLRSSKSPFVKPRSEVFHKLIKSAKSSD